MERLNYIKINELTVIDLHIITIFVTILFFVGMFGVLLIRRDFILTLISVELMLLAAVLNLIAFSAFFGSIDGEVLIVFILVIAAAETALVLAIIYNFYTLFQTIDLNFLEVNNKNTVVL